QPPPTCFWSYPIPAVPVCPDNSTTTRVRPTLRPATQKKTGHPRPVLLCRPRGLLCVFRSIMRASVSSSLLRRFRQKAPIDEVGKRRPLGEIAQGDERIEVGLDAVLGQCGPVGDHLLADIEVIGGRRDLLRSARILGENGDNVVAIGRLVDI